MSSTTVLQAIDEELDKIKEFRASSSLQIPSTEGEHPTIKNFTGVENAVKFIVKIVGKSAICVSLEGDESILGWEKKDLVGKDMVVTLKLDISYVNRVYVTLLKQGFVFKRNSLVGKDGRRRELNSMMMKLDKTTLVEISWDPQKAEVL